MSRKNSSVLPGDEDDRRVSLSGYTNIILDDDGSTIVYNTGTTNDKPLRVKFDDLPVQGANGEVVGYSGKLKRKFSEALPIHKPLVSSSKDGVLPINRVNIFSYVFMTWLSPLIWGIYRRRNGTLVEADIWQMSKEESTVINTERLTQLWQLELKSKRSERASIGRVCRQLITRRIVVLSLIAVLNCVAAFLSVAFLLNRVVAYLETEDATLLQGIGLTVAMAASEIVRATSFATCILYGLQTGVRFRTAFMGIMYDKLLRMKNIGGKTNSEIISIFTVDSYRVHMLGQALSFVILAPASFILSAIYCYILIGYWTFVVVVVFALCAIVQVWLSKLLQRFRHTTSQFTATRVRYIREALNNMRFIKTFGWEKPFTEAVTATRMCEQKYLLLSAVVFNISSSIIPIMPTIASVVAISVYNAAGNELTASVVFALVGVMNYLRLAVATLPHGVRHFAEAKISFNRLKTLLLMDEYSPPNSECFDDSNSIELKSADFLWENLLDQDKNSASSQTSVNQNGTSLRDRRKSVRMFLLNDINLDLKRGQLIGICGTVGSGKSSLISAIMGTMHQTRGHLAVKGAVAFVPQQALIINETVKQNILFGSEFNKKWYDKVLDACCLRPDLLDLQDGDETEIGERGCNLSGGQKQRINIARAVYSDRDIYLLDDPLSAVDVRVGRRLFRECIKGLLGNKTVLLVTHQLQYLKDCDQVVVMDRGNLLECGPPHELLANNGKYTEIMKIFGNTSMETNKRRSAANVNENNNPFQSSVSVTAKAKERDEIKDPNKTKVSLVTAEESIVGDIWFGTYHAFIRASGGWLAAIVVGVLYLLSSGVVVFADYWLSLWVDERVKLDSRSAIDHNQTNQSMNNVSQFSNVTIRWTTENTNINRSNLFNTSTLNKLSLFGPATQNNSDLYAIIYASVVPLTIVIQILVGFCTAKVLIVALNNLHKQCVERVMKASMSFFDSTPVGRILNRFTKDVDEVDVFIPEMLTSFLRLSSVLLFSMGMSAVASPWILIIIFPVVVVFGIMKRLSRASVTQLKRLENIARSPLISHVNTSSQGLQTIVAYGQEERFSKQYESYADVTCLVMFLFDSSMRWIGLRLDLVASLVLVGSTLIFVLSKATISPATAALVLGLCGKNVNVMQFLIQMLNETEARFTSVERIREWGKNLIPEPSTSKKTPNAEWPNKGSIIFKDVVMKYRPESESVLRSVRFEIHPQEKVGVVGRTGAGKSSLAAVLFRLVDITSGQVFIDNEDIADLPLDVLRASISSISQDPVLFAGTIRYNIDPFTKYSDDEVWQALEKVHMKDKISDMETGLEALVEEGGENFSVGERQLMCLARAVLRSSKILVLDEATANVDTSTDAKIQETLRTCFRHSTVITIAHRLNTVLHSDKIIVLDAGQVMECASPQDLLSNPHSFFNKMISAHTVKTP